jgi:hypothetical protein
MLGITRWKEYNASYGVPDSGICFVCTPKISSHMFVAVGPAVPDIERIGQHVR